MAELCFSSQQFLLFSDELESVSHGIHLFPQAAAMKSSGLMFLHISIAGAKLLPAI